MCGLLSLPRNFILELHSPILKSSFGLPAIVRQRIRCAKNQFFMTFPSAVRGQSEHGFLSPQAASCTEPLLHHCSTAATTLTENITSKTSKGRAPSGNIIEFEEFYYGIDILSACVFEGDYRRMVSYNSSYGMQCREASVNLAPTTPIAKLRFPEMYPPNLLGSFVPRNSPSKVSSTCVNSRTNQLSSA